MKAIFFDRDNTLIIDSGYMHDPSQLKFYPDTFRVLQELSSRGYKLFILTNQSGLGRGYFTQDQLDIFHRKMLQEFKKNNIEFEAILFCPHSPIDKCDCRKPSPKLLLEQVEKYNLNKSTTYMVGDRDSDYECGIKAGVNSILIKDGSELPKLLTQID